MRYKEGKLKFAVSFTVASCYKKIPRDARSSKSRKLFSYVLFGDTNNRAELNFNIHIFIFAR